MHNLDAPFTVGEDEGSEPEQSKDELGRKQPWEHEDYGESSSSAQRTPEYGSFREERNVWGDDGK